jgi:hypothetical protein
MTRLPYILLFVGVVAFLLVDNRRQYASNPTTTGGIVVPYYGAQFNGGGADNKRIIELLEEIRNSTVSIDTKLAGTQPLKKPDLLTVAKANCLSCHSPSKAEKSGGDFVMFADDKGTALKPFSGREKVRITQRVADGEMPPNKALDADTKSSFKW